MELTPQAGHISHEIESYPNIFHEIHWNPTFFASFNPIQCSVPGAEVPWILNTVSLPWRVLESSGVAGCPMEELPQTKTVNVCWLAGDFNIF